MNGIGTVEAIHTAPEAEHPMESKNVVRAVAEKGLRGDRYFKQAGTFSDVPRGGLEITFTEAEAIEAIVREADIALGFADHRRNITTRDAALNHLVGERFRVGDAVCEGVRLCEPCDHLRRLTADGVIEALAHRGGLRAEIVESGTIRVGDALEPL
ncbi:MOSC domain-containing protein [Natronosalvus rutilus]|uniref:MOSC domain-containing protein n=1 Tax=Natronosalvus rutilus TaxID=2953753 RepID=A0A9E7NF09_9EURY|nr:MOSC domain-containing protein [Natronosalvus rutilus]UTF55668.1 MOSC domain-containing protein [Natronosalvus rutilus]